MAEKTFVFDAEGMILGRLASATADLLLKAAREDRDDKVIIVNAVSYTHLTLPTKA